MCWLLLSSWLEQLQVVEHREEQRRGMTVLSLLLLVVVVDLIIDSSSERCMGLTSSLRGLVGGRVPRAVPATRDTRSWKTALRATKSVSELICHTVQAHQHQGRPETG